MFTEYPARFSAHLSLHGFHPERYLSPMFSQNGQSDNSTFMRQDARPCRMVSAVIHERLCLFIPVPFQSRFIRGVFSASHANHAQSGRYPSGQAIQFSRCKEKLWQGLISSLHLLGSGEPECFLILEKMKIISG